MRLTDFRKQNELSYAEIKIIFESASKKQLLTSVSHAPFGLHDLFESCTWEEREYFSLCEQELMPLMTEFLTFLAEADLTPDQINQIFGKAVAQAQASGTNKTKFGKAVEVGKKAASGAKKVAGITIDVSKAGAEKVAKAMAIQKKIKDKIGALLQNSKPVKKIDELYDKAVAKLEEAMGGPDAEISKIIRQISAWLKKHPMMASGVVSVLTLLATVTLGTGGLTISPLFAVAGITKSAVIGYFLRFVMELLKGEKLSTAAGKGIWGALVGAIGHMGFAELEHLLGDPIIKTVYEIQTTKDPGVNISSFQELITTVDADGKGQQVYLSFMGTPDEIESIRNTVEKAKSLIDAHKLDDATEVLNSLSDQDFRKGAEKIARVFTETPQGGQKFSQIMGNFMGQKLADQSAAQQAIMKVATDFESHVRTISQGLQAASVALGAGFAGNKKQTTPEAINEVNWQAAKDKLKSVGSQAAQKYQQAKSAAGTLTSKAGAEIAKRATEYTDVVTLKKLQAAWEKAGKPTDDAAVAKILTGQGFESNDVKKIFKDAGFSEPAVEPTLGTELATKVGKDLTADTGDNKLNQKLATIKGEVDALLKAGKNAEAMQKLQAYAKEYEAKPAAAKSAAKPAAVKPAAAKPAAAAPTTPAKSAAKRRKSPVKGSTTNEGKIMNLTEKSSYFTVMGLVHKFNTEVHGYWMEPLRTTTPGRRVFTRGDGSKYRDPGVISVGSPEHFKPQDWIPKFWEWLMSQGAKKTGDVSGEFRASASKPTVKLGGLIFINKGNFIEWGASSRLKNVDVWRQSKLAENLDTVLELAQSITLALKENRISRTEALKKMKPLLEFASGGATSAGGIASLPNAGGPMMPIIRRMPAGQSFFGPAGTAPQAKQKRVKKKSKRT